MTRLCRTALVVAIVATVSACNPIYFVGVKFYYKRADLPSRQILHDVYYDPVGVAEKRQLDLYMPTGTARWPVVVFVHGGAWTEGDRALTVGGADVYGNIGRFLAVHGIGAAVISYRLIPSVDWKAQAGDVAAAVGWVYETIALYGGRRDSIFLMGHSAGAQLAVRTAFDPAALASVRVPTAAIAGVIGVSGAAYDLVDQGTYDLGHVRSFYAERFQLGATDVDWQKTASVIQFARPNAPPSLLIFAGGETAPLQRQSHVLYDALKAAGATTSIVEVPGLTHTRIVPTLSRDDRPAGAAVLRFISDVMSRRK